MKTNQQLKKEFLENLPKSEKAKMMFLIKKKEKENSAEEKKETITDKHNSTKSNKMEKLNLPYFKFSIIMILIGFLYVYYEYSQNGRYYISDKAIIIDTRTGKSFWPVENNDSYIYREKNIYTSKK